MLVRVGELGGLLVVMSTFLSTLQGAGKPLAQGDGSVNTIDEIREGIEKTGGRESSSLRASGD